LNDTTPHDSRYERLVEYTQVIRQLIEARSPLTFEGRFYKVEGLSMQPRIAPELVPGILVSGSSEAGRHAARAMGAVAVKYPEPPEQCAPDSSDQNNPCGVRVGIIARASDVEAWRVALERFSGGSRWTTYSSTRDESI
jgi:alkanesulfonate monooxygenase